MKLIDKISASKISDLSYDDVKLWLMEEIADLCADMGQKLDDEQKQHIPARMMLIFVDKYRNWEPGKIHAIFQRGITGAYGSKTTKLTVALLLSWITSEDKTLRGENVQGFIMNDEKLPQSEIDRFSEIADRCLPFIKFCDHNAVDITGLSQDEYYALRNKYNIFGESGIRSDIERLPKYRNFEISNMIKFR